MDTSVVNQHLIESLLFPSESEGQNDSSRTESDNGQVASQLRAAFELSPVPTMFLSLEGKVTLANAAALDLLNLSEGDARLIDFVPEREQSSCETLLSRLRDGSRSDGHIVVSDAAGVSLSRWLLTRIGDQIVAIDQASRSPQGTGSLADIDALTGLPNRRLIERKLQSAIDRDDRHWGVLFIDLDNYKQVNDCHGHVVGDDVLVSFANNLRASFRPGDSVARYGGDEFVALIDRIPGTLELKMLADRIAGEVCVVVDGADDTASIEVTASIGCAMAPEGTTTIEDMIAAADRDMYRVKRKAR